MKIRFATCLVVVFALFLPVLIATSHSQDEAEGSWFDFDYSGSGDADGEFVHSDEDHKRRLEVQSEGYPDLTLDRSRWPTVDSDVILLPSHEGFLDNYDRLAAVVAGGVVGATLAAAVATFLILKWQKTDTSVSRRQTKNQDRFLTNREEYVV
ncbi:uncharacterized protein ACB058_013079 [Synchiropus picturatus]